MSMFRSAAARLFRPAAARLFRHAKQLVIAPQQRGIHHLQLMHESLEDLTHRYECFFCRTDIDGWDIRQAMNDLSGMDLIPDPRVIIASLYACRRVCDYALAVRYLEAIKYKCESYNNTIYPYVLQEIGPTLCELGIETPEGLGYDKPEMFLPDVLDC